MQINTRLQFAVVWASLSVAAQAADKPNILYVMSDDHAYQAISAYGGHLSKVIQTPNIDQLAKEGMIFHRAMVPNSICCPARACVLTGKYSHMNGQIGNSDKFDGSQQTLPKLLMAAGYETAIIGKWHLYTEPTGFDYYSVLHGQGKYINSGFKEIGKWPKAEVHAGYVTEVITKDAIKWMKERNSDKPFFLMVHHKAPHRICIPQKKHYDKLKNTVIPEPATLYDDYKGRSDASKVQTQRIAKNMGRRENKVPKHMKGKARTRLAYQNWIKDYLATSLSVDDSIGELMAYLKESGQADNTIVVYTSDQGLFLGEHGWFDKRFMYEECLRTPLLIRYPKLIKPGSVCYDMVMNIDYAPTFLELAGVTIPADIQGKSMVPVLKGETPADWRKQVYYRYYDFPDAHQVERHYGIRTERYKLIHFYYSMDQWEMYDLKEDPHEVNNLASNPEYKVKFEKLKKQLYALQAQVKDKPYDKVGQGVRNRKQAVTEEAHFGKF